MSNPVVAAEWRHMYFYGITKKFQNEIDLSQEQVRGLLSLVNVHSGISTGAAVDPLLLINAKGTTVWLAMYALLVANDQEALIAAKKEEALLYVPSKFLNGLFNQHNNWPVKILARYDLKLKNYNLFVVPFLIPKSGGSVKNLSQSLKAPDGSLEVFGVQEFNDMTSEKLLAEFDSIIKFIISERPDVTNN